MGTHVLEELVDPAPLEVLSREVEETDVVEACGLIDLFAPGLWL